MPYFFHSCSINALDQPHVHPMPTPSDSTDALPLERQRSTHTTCPPEDDRPGQWRVEVLDRLDRTALDISLGSGESRQLEDPSSEAESPSPSDTIQDIQDQSEDQKVRHGASMEPTESTPPPMDASPSVSHSDEKEVERRYPTAPTSSALDLQYSIRYGIESTRVCRSIHKAHKNPALTPVQLIQTHTSSMLRAGSKFRGTQQSEHQKYSVEVDIKTVDMSESFICGYLKIEGTSTPPPLNPPPANPPPQA